MNVRNPPAESPAMTMRSAVYPCESSHRYPSTPSSTAARMGFRGIIRYATFSVDAFDSAEIRDTIWRWELIPQHRNAPPWR